MELVKICYDCQSTTIFNLDPIQYALWLSGTPIQQCFPDLSPDDRELLISGICGSCFDSLFAE